MFNHVNVLIYNLVHLKKKKIWHYWLLSFNGMDEKEFQTKPRIYNSLKMEKSKNTYWPQLVNMSNDRLDYFSLSTNGGSICKRGNSITG